MTTADMIFEALRQSMSEPGCGYIDFTWRPTDPDGDPRGAENARDLAEDLAARMPDSIDAAWAEAEAALPEGWYLGVQHSNDDRGAYMAIAADMVWLTESLSDEWHAFGPSPAAALRALAAKLRERAG